MSEYGQGSVNNTIGWQQAVKTSGAEGYGELIKNAWSPSTNLTGIPSGYANTKSYTNEYNGNVVGATANSGDLSYLNNQGIISASVWFTIESQLANSSNQFVTMINGRTAYFRFQLGYDVSQENPRYTIFLVINTVAVLQTSIVATLNNGWHNVITTYDTNGGGKFYVDGVEQLVDSQSQSAFTSTSVKPTFFGGTGVLNEYNATQLAIWNRVLTSQEVSDVYNNGCPSDLTSLNPNTWLKIDDASGDASSTTIPDSGSDNATIVATQPFANAIETDSPCP